MPLTPRPSRRKRRKRHRSQKLPSTAAFLLRQREPGKKSARKKGSGQEYPGRRRCGQCAHGCSPGSCCGAIGAAGRHCPHLLRCRCCSNGLSAGRPSRFTVQLDPRPQSTGSAAFLIGDKIREEKKTTGGTQR